MPDAPASPAPATLQQGLDLVGKVRSANPGSGLESMNDQEVASMLHDQTGDDRLLPLKNSSALARGDAAVHSAFDSAGNTVEQAVGGDPATSSFPRRLAGRVVGNVVRGAPGMAAGVASATLDGVPSALAALTGATDSYLNTKSQTGDTKAGLGSAAGFLTSLGGATKGAEVGEELGKDLGGLGKFAAGTAGAAVGSVPGDYLGQVTQPGEDLKLSQFRKDPLNLPSYAATQPVVGAAFEMAHKALGTRQSVAEANKAATPDLSDIVSTTDADELARLQQKPVQSRTELDLARMNDISKRLADLDESKLQSKAAPPPFPASVTEDTETPATLKAQVHLLNNGKKALVQIPAGSELPTLPSYLQKYTEHSSEVDNNLYLYDSTKTNPDQIDNAIKTNSLGHLLGYGTPGVPPDPNGNLAVLRSRRGTEKAAVVLSDTNQNDVIAALGKQALGDDTVGLETPDQVLNWRKQNSGIQSLFSLSKGEEAQGNEDDSYFQNHVLDMFGKSLVGTDSKGARFQLDQNGNLGGAGLLKAVKQWSPSELWEHYKAQGIETLLGANKVSANTFTDWLRANTPEIEVKKLVPSEPHNVDSLVQEQAAIQHHLESAGYEVDNGHDEIHVMKGGEFMTWDDMPEELKPTFQRLGEIREALGDPQNSLGNDAATGKYGVEPKDLKDMPGAVDMLVRVPQKLVSLEEANKGRFIPGAVKDGKVAEAPLFRGPHFGRSDVNVLASVRGYIENHPTLDKIFHVFELQSDWGQKVNRTAEEMKKWGTSDVVQQDAEDYRKSKGHALLPSYETLGLKAAIQHAREQGITKLAISDAETAMMTEGHDRQGNNYHVDNPDGTRSMSSYFKEDLEARIKTWNDAHRDVQNNPGVYYDPKDIYFKPEIKQEGGMRAAYDQRLPDIMKKLTGDAGQRVDFGHHIGGDTDPYDRSGEETPEELEASNRGGSPVFKDKDGLPKTNVTARVFDISNPKPEVRRLFSLYDADAQASLESTMDKELADVHSDKTRSDSMTPEQLLQRSVAGDRSVENDSIVKFIASIKGERGALREGNFLTDGITAKMDQATRDITFNKNLTLRVNEAFTVLSHELTHGAIFDLAEKNPEAYQYLKQNVSDLGFNSRLSILSGLKEKLGLGDKFNPEYLAGKLFDPKDPYIEDKIAHEFSAGLTEALAQHYYNSESKPSWLRFVPAPVAKVLEGVATKLSKYFGKDFPSIGNMLSAREADRIGKITNLLNDHVISNRDANFKALFDLHSTGIFDEGSFPDRLPTITSDYAKGVKNTNGGVGELHSFAGDLAKQAGVLKEKAENFYKDLFFSGLFRAKTQPYTKDFFFAMHGMRPTTQAEIYGYHAFLGQLPDGSLSREQSLERAGKYLENLTSPFNGSRDKTLVAFSRIFEENTNRREAALSEGKNVTPDILVSKEEAQSKFGLSEEDAEYAQRFAKLPELVAEESARKQESVDTINLSKMFLRANPEQDINGIKARVLRLNRISNDFGAQRFELNHLDERLSQEQRKPQPDEDYMKSLQQRMDVLSAQEKQFKVLMDQNIRSEFAGAIPIKGGPLEDPFINGVSEAMVRQAALRFNQKFITKDPGYAPMTRRGRFLLRVYEPNELGEEFGKVREMRGFDDEKTLDKYVKDNGITQFQKIDKETLKGRAEVFTPDKLKSVRDRAKAELGELVQQFSDRSKTNLDPKTREALLGVLNDFEHSFQPLEDEIKNVVSVQGDKFKERRYLVPGFDRNDYLPNIFEYMDYKTVSGNKEIAKAEGALQMERKEIVADPALKERMGKELNYNLSNQSEFGSIRKAIYYYYLGASVRHVVQYGVQLPLNGISQMVAEGHGLDSYAHFTKGALLAAKYSFKGTTGDKTIDVLLKQAQKDGISLASAIEAPLHETVTIQNALDAINNRHEGSMGFGEKLGHVGTQVAKGFEKFLMSTSSASDEANKKATFIASILAQRSKGEFNPKVLYGKASDFTNFVNFVGDKPNRPGYLIKSGGTPMHGPLMLASTLQSFVTNHVSQLYSFYEKGFKQGSVNDRRALYTGLAHLLAFSGSMGMVGASLAEQLFQEATDVSLRTAMRKGMVQTAMNLSGDDDPKGSAAHVADRLSDGILYGIPGMLGIDSSDSIGLGSPFFRYQAGEPITAETLGGSGAGILGRVAMAAHDVKVDPFNPQQWWSALRTASPAFIANSIKAYDMLNSGSTLSSKGEPVGEPLGVAGSASALMGFAPEQVSKERDFQTQVYDQTKLHAEDYQRNVVNISRLLSDFERTGNQESLNSAMDQFSHYVDSTGQLQDRDEMIDSITDQVRAMQGKVTVPASLKESQTRQGLETAFPSVTSHYPSKVDAAVDGLKVSQLLGQDDVTARQLKGLPSGLLEKVLTDGLVQAGVRPEHVQQLLKPDNELKLGPAR